MSQSLPPEEVKRSLLQRVFGRSASAKPADPGCWSIHQNKILVELDRAPELRSPGGAIRIESDDLPHRVLVFVGEDGGIRALCNECPHGKRRVDPVPGKQHVQCCSVGRSIYTYDGALVQGSAEHGIPTYKTEQSERWLIVHIPLTGPGS